jgi:hypothetical protein
MASASLRSLPRPRGKRVCLTSMDCTVVSYIATGHRRRGTLVAVSADSPIIGT